MFNLRLRITSLIGGVAGLLLLALIHGCNKAPAQPGGFPPAMVAVTRVSQQDVPLYIDQMGKTSASEMVTIEPQVSGKILTRKFVEGDDVARNQRLYQIDPAPFQALLDSAQASSDQADAQFSNAMTDFSRDSDLIASKAISQQDYDDKKNAVAVAAAQVAAAKAAVKTARLNLNYCQIKSPLAGRTGQALIDPGNIVTQNITPLVVIQKISPIYVDFTVTESDLARVRESMAGGTLKVFVWTPQDADHPIEGNLTFLDNTVQSDTGTVHLRATLANADKKLWPGQFVQVRLILATLKNAMLLPVEAIQVGQSGPYVYRVNAANMPEQVNVQLGQRQGGLQVITSGLDPADNIVLTNQVMIIPGLPVVVTNPATQPTSQPATEASTQPDTEPSTQPSTEPSTQPTTQPGAAQ